MRLDGSGLVDRKVPELAAAAAAGSTGTSVPAILEKGGNGKPSSKKIRRRPQKKLHQQAKPAVQKLFDACRDVFSSGAPGIIPSPEDVERIRAVLDSMKLADVNLAKTRPYFSNIRSAKGRPPVTYLHVYECEKFSIGIFCLPPTAVIPLHNHPGMTVFSKLLFGSMRIRSYDWVHNSQEADDSTDLTQLVQPPGMRLAKVNTDAVYTAPCSTSVLYPANGGNIHRFTALTACAVLDVLGPPYCDPEGRHCTYYNDFPYAKFSGDASNKVTTEGVGYAWLEEREKPENFYVQGAEYTGPVIVDM